MQISLCHSSNRDKMAYLSLDPAGSRAAKPSPSCRPTLNDLPVCCVRIVLVDDSLDCLISFTDFVYALQLQLYYAGASCLYKRS